MLFFVFLVLIYAFLYFVVNSRGPRLFAESMRTDLQYCLPVASCAVKVIFF